MSNLIYTIGDSIEKIDRKYKISLIYLFDSEAKLNAKFLRDENIKTESYSDLDIAMLFESAPKSSLFTYREPSIDFSLLFYPFEIDLVFIDEVDSLSKYELVKGFRIQENDIDFADSFKEFVIKKASDPIFKQRDFVKEVSETIKYGYC